MGSPMLVEYYLRSWNGHGGGIFEYPTPAGERQGFDAWLRVADDASDSVVGGRSFCRFHRISDFSMSKGDVSMSRGWKEMKLMRYEIDVEMRPISVV